MKKKRRTVMIAGIVTAFYLAGITSALHAIMTTRTPQGAIAWSVSLVSFPFVAVPAYLVFGRSKFEGMVDALEDRRDEIEELLAEFYENLKPWAVESNARSGDYRAIRELSRVELTRGNSAKLLIDGDATFDDMLAGIAAAREYALVQFYMFHDDGLGRRMQQAMIERAKAGVRVYMLYDEVGSKGLPQRYVDELREAGVEVSSFKPTQGARNRFQLNFRNHRKMVVVDGKVGWVGGHNVGDEYLGLDPDFSPWRDTHVRLEGPVVMQLQAVILGDWYWATREFPQVSLEPRAADNGDVQAMIFPSAPSQRLETAGLFFVGALNSAETRIWLSAPYFVPDEAVIKALELAALRGVDVRIVTTGKSDNLVVSLAAFHYMDQLRDLGIRFYAFTPGFLHEKVVLVDDDVSAVGTANFDNRSFRLNFEVMALIADRDFASEMVAMFEADFAHAVEIDPAEFDKKPFWWKLGVNLSRLAAPVL
ncbi:MAG: cardiolipin synthase [Gammaproteobacteria bacterium]|nr:cardiolipin synthase [Gammaproteobacteria bacterium]